MYEWFLFWEGRKEGKLPEERGAGCVRPWMEAGESDTFTGTVDSYGKAEHIKSGAVPQNCLFCRESEVLRGLCNRSM